MAYDLKMRVWRGDAVGGALGDYTVEGSVDLKHQPLPEMPDELKPLFEEA